jgi:hypothetical protein
MSDNAGLAAAAGEPGAVDTLVATAGHDAPGHSHTLKLHQLRRKQFFVRPEDISDSGGELLLRVCTWLCVEVCVSCTVMWLVFGA